MDEICLLNTMLIKTDGSKMLFPNIAMASQGIINIARSGLHGEFFLVRPPHPTLRQTRIPNSVPAACCMRHPLQPQCLGLSAANDHMNTITMGFRGDTARECTCHDTAGIPASLPGSPRFRPTASATCAGTGRQSPLHLKSVSQRDATSVRKRIWHAFAADMVVTT